MRMEQYRMGGKILQSAPANCSNITGGPAGTVVAVATARLTYSDTPVRANVTIKKALKKNASRAMLLMFQA
jgi:hypothetical protein